MTSVMVMSFPRNWDKKKLLVVNSGLESNFSLAVHLVHPRVHLGYKFYSIVYSFCLEIFFSDLVSVSRIFI